MVEQDSKTTRTNFAAFNQKTFNHQNAGKLRDFYRIGKMLGSGKAMGLSFRSLRRSQNVRSQRDRSLESCESFAQEPYGRRGKENAF